jgi:hypothetical protein
VTGLPREGVGHRKLCFLRLQIMDVSWLPIDCSAPADPFPGNRPFINNRDLAMVSRNPKKIALA